MFESDRMFEGFINIKYLTSGIFFKQQLEQPLEENRKIKYFRLSNGFKEAHNRFQKTNKDKH